MKYILDDKEVKQVSQAYEITQQSVHRLLYKINSYKADPECSLYGELDHILLNDTELYDQLKFEYKYRP
jgi:hypothetical protein